MHPSWPLGVGASASLHPRVPWRLPSWSVWCRDSLGQSGLKAACVGYGRDMTQPGKARAGGEKRGNATDRRARKSWMLKAWGDGASCPCVHCGNSLDFASVEADRIVPGGSYRRDNVQPACRSCNLSRSNNVSWKLVTA